MMTMIRNFLLAVFILPLVYSDIEAEASGEVLTDDDYHHYERPKLFNWDYKDLSAPTFEDLSSSRPTFGDVDPVKCPDGWLRFSDSCYYYEQDMLSFSRAEKRCHDKKSTLFVANSMDEWDTIRQHTPKGFFSWIGLIRFNQYEKSELMPRWQTEGAISPNKINWLVRPYMPTANGWTKFANCAVHFNPPAAFESASYVFYYPCTFQMYSICERNLTLVNFSSN